MHVAEMRHVAWLKLYERRKLHMNGYTEEQIDEYQMYLDMHGPYVDHQGKVYDIETYFGEIRGAYLKYFHNRVNSLKVKHIKHGTS